IARASNRQLRDSDPSAHAEIVALREAGKVLRNYRLDDCDIYVTVEPCLMCREALKRARIRSVYYAAPAAREATHIPEYIEESSFSGAAGKLIREFFSGKR
ncbi:MAG: nucleoside deaminase, partial [Elusimicrobia bacterium]|nr:nucleoside deaminase [Elusimicrobiota bacterium]